MPGFAAAIAAEEAGLEPIIIEGPGNFGVPLQCVGGARGFTIIR